MYRDISTLVKRYLKEIDLPVIEINKVNEEEVSSIIRGCRVRFLFNQGNVCLSYTLEDEKKHYNLDVDNYKQIINMMLVRIAQDARCSQQDSVSQSNYSILDSE